MDLDRARPVIGNTIAGLSGPALKPIALRHVWQVAGCVDVPIIGCGGISNARDALEFIYAGASAVQVGTATFFNPRAPMEVLARIEAFCIEKGVASIRDLVGAGRPDRPSSPHALPAIPVA
jgi:dihydroorotate dehydrogenase (NAD+) catalytic subunit